MTSPESSQKNMKNTSTMNYRAALMKDGGKPFVHPSLAKKKQSEDLAMRRQEEAALLKEWITYYAEKLSNDVMPLIKKMPYWTDPMDQIYQFLWTDNLKKLRDLKSRLERSYDRREKERLEKFKEEHNGMTPREVEQQELREAISGFIANTTRDERVYWFMKHGHYLTDV